MVNEVRLWPSFNCVFVHCCWQAYIIISLNVQRGFVMSLLESHQIKGLGMYQNEELSVTPLFSADLCQAYKFEFVILIVFAGFFPSQIQ